MNDDLVVLVDEQDRELGTMAKSLVHTNQTPLHRGLSVFIFDHPSHNASGWRGGRVIVQQRALHKKTWPGVWSNSCCGHPLPGETYEQAAKRKVKEELGIEVEKLAKVANYRYRFERNGVVENEICPVFKGLARGEVKTDPREVADWKWMAWGELLATLNKDDEQAWSPWCKEEVLLLDPLIRVS